MRGVENVERPPAKLVEESLPLPTLDVLVTAGLADNQKSEPQESRSEHNVEYNELFSALAKAQSKIKPAKLDAKNPFYKSSYATISSVKAAYKDAFAENGLSVIQMIESNDNGYFLTTYLTHSSGQFMSSTFKLKTDDKKDDMQSLGSAITYAKRYALAAMTGVVDEEDDDGNATVQKPVVNSGYAVKNPPPNMAPQKAWPTKPQTQVKAQTGAPPPGASSVLEQLEKAKQNLKK